MFGSDPSSDVLELDNSQDVVIETPSNSVKVQSNNWAKVPSEQAIAVDVNQRNLVVSSIHIPVLTKSATNNVNEKSEVLARRVVQVRKYSLVTNESNHPDHIDRLSQLTVPYMEIEYTIV